MIQTALLIILDSRGLVLLQQKTYDAPNYPGVWSFFGGKVEEGETVLTAARRELREELGIELSPSDFEYFQTFTSSGGQPKERHVFIVRIADDVPLTLKEGRGLGYFTSEEIAHLQMPDHIREILTVYFGSTDS